MRKLLFALAAFGLVAGAASLAGFGARNNSSAACAATAPTLARMAPFARGEVAAVQVNPSPRLATALNFLDAEGKPVTLESFRGRTVLLNLWATWCAPCREEMPALDRLQATLGGDGFQVVAVNIDQRNLERPRRWLEENGISRLAYHSDPSVKIFQDLKAVGRAVGMPTTLLVDGQGCELAHINGPADWASEDALKLVRAALGS